MIEVTTGTGTGKTNQMKRIADVAEGKRVALYGPKVGGTVAKDLEKSGIPVFKTMSALLAWVKRV